MIDPEFGKKWVEALRSGKYKQGRFGLCIGDEYCCLGVACEVAGLKKEIEDAPELKRVVYNYGGSRCAAPSSLYKFGINSCGSLANGDILMSLNDAGTSFDEIANLIEKEVNAQAL